MGLFGLLTIVGSTGFLAWTERARLLQDAGAEAASEAFFLADHAARLFEVTDVALHAATAAIGDRSWDDIAHSERLPNELAALTNALPYVEDISLTDASGRLRLTSMVLPAPDADVSDRLDFTQARQGDEGLIVGDRVPGRPTSQATFSISRRLEWADGSFRGMISGTADLAYFSDYWRQVHWRYHARVDLLRAATLEVIARYPGTPGDPALVLSPPDRARLAEVAGGISVAPVRIAKGLGAYRPVGNFPLLLGVTFSRDAVLARWHAWLRLYLPLAAIALVGLGLLTGLAFRQGRREARAAAILVRTRGDLAAANLRLRREIADRERAEVQLVQAQRMQAVGVLTGGVAHDFNNLLTAILGSLELLETPLRGQPHLLRLVDVAQRAARRGARLTASLLAFARQQVFMLEPLDVNTVLRQSADLIRRAIGDAVCLELDLKDGLPLVSADAAQLEVAILNLAINARDAMPHGGTLKIATRLTAVDSAALAGNDEAIPGLYVEIVVKDTGQGMTAEVAARCLEPFFTTKDVGRGTGLGLSQVYGTVRQLHGHLALLTLPGRGTTVSLYLPTGPRAAAERDPGQGGALDRAVLDGGYGVVAAADAALALKVIRDPTARLDILYTDGVMPADPVGSEPSKRGGWPDPDKPGG